MCALILETSISTKANSTGYTPCVGRVPVSYSEQETQTRDLAITYQAVIIAITFVLSAIFLYFTFLVMQHAKRVASTKSFVMTVGIVITSSYLLRCILFLIVLSADFVSSIYMFITLMITEVIPMIFLFLLFNQRRIKYIASKTRTNTSLSGSGSSGSTSGN